MKEQLKKVAEFQIAFRQNVKQKPTLIPMHDALLRFALMKEETNEYLDACNNKDLVEVADALADQLYILCGTILEHGLQDVIIKCFDEVHRSNMSKLDDDGEPIINGENGFFNTEKPVGKVLKSQNYSEPNLKQFL
jgi:predicted HAD superfamily Cof-like phosphohydrolase